MNSFQLTRHNNIIFQKSKLEEARRNSLRATVLLPPPRVTTYLTSAQLDTQLETNYIYEHDSAN